MLSSQEIYCEYFGRYWPCWHDTTLYNHLNSFIKSLPCMRMLQCQFHSLSAKCLKKKKYQNIYAFLLFLHTEIEQINSSWKDLFIIDSQYHGYWCPSDTRSRGICSHGIVLVLSYPKEIQPPTHNPQGNLICNVISSHFISVNVKGSPAQSSNVIIKLLHQS